jgi:hypothetical protein
MPDGLIEHVVGIELAGERSPGSGQPLRQRSGAALTLVELASLQGSARSSGDTPSQFELLVVEYLLAREEDEHKADAMPGRLRQGHGEKRTPVRRVGRAGQPVAEAVVVEQSA